MEAELAQLRVEVEALRKENATLKAQSRLDKTTVHMLDKPGTADTSAQQAMVAAGTAGPGGRAGYNRVPEVLAALKAAAEDKTSVDADLATATAWVGAAFMDAGKRFASGGMRDRDVPHKPGHTNMNLGGVRTQATDPPFACDFGISPLKNCL